MAASVIGSTVVVELKLYKYTPFGSYALNDDDSQPTIDIWDGGETQRVTAQNMTKSATGKYYYVLNSNTAWVVGHFRVKITATIDSNVEIYDVRDAIQFTEQSDAAEHRADW